MADVKTVTSSSLTALAEQYRAIAHNLANVDTPGYKRLQTTFAQVLAAAGGTGRDAGASPDAAAVRPVTALDFRQGALSQTGGALDLALEGDGFFALETPDGVLYTRSGRFRLNALGQLTDPNGRLVAGDAGPIVAPAAVSPDELHVSADGSVSARGQTIGKLRLVGFDDPSVLVPAGDGCLRAPATAAPGTPRKAVVRQGYYESSNVSAVEELIALITVTRLYEANLKSVQAQDERLKGLLNVAMS